MVKYIIIFIIIIFLFNLPNINTKKINPKNFGYKSLKDRNFKKINNEEEKAKTTPNQENQQYTKSELKRKGDEYELFVGKYFKNQGYKIYYQGLNQGFYDYGIDLIAYRGNEMLLIQCKNWSRWKIDKKVLDKFNKDCKRYINYNKRQTTYKNIRKIFVVSNANITKEALEKLFNLQNNIKFLHLPFDD